MTSRCVAAQPLRPAGRANDARAAVEGIAARAFLERSPTFSDSFAGAKKRLLNAIICAGGIGEPADDALVTAAVDFRCGE